jgi:hypothetical protein
MTPLPVTDTPPPNEQILSMDDQPATVVTVSDAEPVHVELWDEEAQ